MAESQEKKEDKKLDWMYRDASQIVDREEYLLGRKIDKQFETSLLPPDKNQEGVPSSIFSKGSTESQVDIARKLQEDPLYLIKKKEIEWREQLLKNPRKMKQLQEMIAKQQETAEKLKKKQMKKRKKKELDALLVKKCKKIFGKDGTTKLADLHDIDSDTSSSSASDANESRGKKKKKKKKENKNLDRALALKYKKVIGDMDAKGIAEIDSTSESSSEDNEEIKKRRRKERSSSCSSTERKKSDLKKRARNKSEGREKCSSSEGEGESAHGKKYKKGNYNSRHGKDVEQRSRSKTISMNRKKQRGSSSSSDSSDYRRNSSSKYKRDCEKGKNMERKYDYHSRIECREKSDKKYRGKEEMSEKYHATNRSEMRESKKTKKGTVNVRGSHSRTFKRHRSREKSEKDSSRSPSESSSHNINKSAKQLRKGKNISSEGNESNYSSESETKNAKSSKKSMHDLSKRRKDSSRSSSEERKHQPKKQYGLVLPANYVPKKESKEDIKPDIKKEEESHKPYKKQDRMKLTKEEKERKLKEMMENAKWRDEQRDKNIKAFKEKEKAEKDDYVYNEDFMRKQMSLAVSQGTVESRVKANINTIQRSGASMSENFARRK